MYQFVNQVALPSLKAEGRDNTLFFKTPTEEAVVTISAENRIKQVLHKDKVHQKEIEIQEDKIHHIVVGKGNCERDVFHYLLPSPHAHLQLRLGQTIHRGESTWSSLPHHFENYPEKGFEEVFFYLLSGGQQKAIQVGKGMWADGAHVDHVWQVKDRTFGVIPMGYHPVVGEPSVKVSYIWAYLAKKKEWEKI